MSLGEIACHPPPKKIDPHRARYFPLGLPTLGVEDHVVRPVNSVSRFAKSPGINNCSADAKNCPPSLLCSGQLQVAERRRAIPPAPSPRRSCPAQLGGR